MSNSKHLVLLQKGKLADEFALGQLDAMFEQIQTENRPNLVIHFHGGLISKEEGIAKAEGLIPVYEEAKAYPVFFVWDSGLKEAITRNLSEIAQDTIFNRLFQRLVVFLEAKKRQIGWGQPRGDDSSLPNLSDEISLWSEASRMLQGEDSKSFKKFSLPKGTSITEGEQAHIIKLLGDDTVLLKALDRDLTKTPLSLEVIESFQATQKYDGSRGIIGTTMIGVLACKAAQVLKATCRRFASHRDHGLHATLVEELFRALYLNKFGKPAWDSIKSETLQAFGQESLCGGTAFLRQLGKLVSNGRKPTVMLVGHSTGAIYICHWLQHVQETKVLPDDFTFNVIFLAPAVDFELFAHTLNTCGNRIGFFRMFTMTDEYEKQDRVISSSPIYPHSLLYLVSGVLEDEPDKPIVGMQRFFDEALFPGNKFSAISQVRKYFLTPHTNRVVWSVTEGNPGLASTAQSHGGFDSDETTRDSLKHIILENKK